MNQGQEVKHLRTSGKFSANELYVKKRGHSFPFQRPINLHLTLYMYESLNWRYHADKPHSTETALHPTVTRVPEVSASKCQTGPQSPTHTGADSAPNCLKGLRPKPHATRHTATYNDTGD